MKNLKKKNKHSVVLKNIFNELKDNRWEQECPSLNNLVKWNESNLLPDVKNVFLGVLNSRIVISLVSPI